MKTKLITLLGLMAWHIIPLNAQIESKPNQELIQRLEEIHNSDQESRDELMTVLEQKGRDSDEFKAINKKVSQIDSVNTSEITQILDQNGWLGESTIGKQGNITLFLIIQHANLQTQKKYIPMLEDAVKSGNAKPIFLAMLQDRIAMLDGEKQIYGSQLNTNKETDQLYVHPILNPENVDKRRAEVGLGKLSDYLAMFGVKWDIEEHKRLVIEFEKSNDK